MEAVNLDAMLTRFAEHWPPKEIAQVNDYDVRIVKIQGEFTWHRHADTDEFLLVLDGQLTIQMQDRTSSPVSADRVRPAARVAGGQSRHSRRVTSCGRTVPAWPIIFALQSYGGIRSGLLQLITE